MRSCFASLCLLFYLTVPYFAYSQTATSQTPSPSTFRQEAQSAVFLVSVASGQNPGTGLYSSGPASTYQGTVPVQELLKSNRAQALAGTNIVTLDCSSKAVSTKWRGQDKQVALDLFISASAGARVTVTSDGIEHSIEKKDYTTKVVRAGKTTSYLSPFEATASEDYLVQLWLLNNSSRGFSRQDLAIASNSSGSERRLVLSSQFDTTRLPKIYAQLKTRDGREPWAKTLWFDDAARILRVDDVIVSRSGEIRHAVRFSDFRSENGITVPHHFDEYVNGTLANTIELTSITCTSSALQ